jgi:hypothetical protein
VGRLSRWLEPQVPVDEIAGFRKNAKSPRAKTPLN